MVGRVAKYFIREIYIPLSMNIVWISPERIFKGMKEQEQLEKMDFRHSGKNGGTMASAFLPIHTHTHTNRNPKDIYFFPSLIGHPFIFHIQFLFLFFFFCTLTQKHKIK